MRVLFVAQEVSYEPQGIMSMSAVLRRAGHDVALTVASLEDPIAFARSYGPDILGFSVMTGSQRGALSWNRRLRDAVYPVRRTSGLPPPVSVFGGPHPTFFPDLIYEDGVDGVCIGEGEGAILDLANRMAQACGEEFDPAIPNLWLKRGGEIVRNPVRPLIQNLSGLPQPDRALIYDKHATLAGSAIKHFMTSRGCPYNCTFCFNHAYYRIYQGARRFYQRTVDDVISEVNAVRARWPLEQVVFVDDLMIIHDDWLAEFANKWPVQVGLPFFANIRAEVVVRRPQKVQLLRQAGCHAVSMGIECANDRIRMELLGRRMTRDEIVQAGRMVRAAGMSLSATNMLALPTSTLEDEFATMRLNAEARVSYAYCWPFQPYPGTRLGQFARDQGLLAGTYDDIGELAADRTILAFADESARTQVEHLARLFALGVDWPWLEPVIRRLIRLPHNRVVDAVFWWVQKLHKGYAIYRRIHPVSAGPRQLFRTALHFMRIKS